jgi:hypothetical protein
LRQQLDLYHRHHATLDQTLELVAQFSSKIKEHRETVLNEVETTYNEMLKQLDKEREEIVTFANQQAQDQLAQLEDSKKELIKVRETLGSVSAGLDTLSQRDILSKEYEWTGMLSLRYRPEDAYIQENVTLRSLINYRFHPATKDPKVANDKQKLLGAIVFDPVHLFDTSINSQYLEFTEGDSVVTMVKSRSSPTFAVGVGRISKGRFECRLKIEKLKKDPIFFGFITNSAFYEKKNDEFLVSMCSYAWPTNFGWTTRDLVYVNGILQSGQGYRGDIKSGDIIELELDCNTNMLTARFPRANHPFHLELPPLEPQDSWRFHVNMAGSSDSVRILEKERKSANP